MIITVAGTQIDFKASIPLTLNSPLFSDEITHSLQFTVKDTPANRKAFGYINRTDIADNKEKELPCTIECGLFYLQGTIVVKYSNGSFSCYFKASGDFYSKTKDISVKNVVTGEESFANNAAAEDYIENCIANPVGKLYAFPKCINRKAFDKFPVKFNSTNTVNDYETEPLIGANSPSIPFPYLYQVFRNIFKNLGYNLSSDVFEEHPELKKLCIPNNLMLNEFAINKQVLDYKDSFIKSMASGTDPEVVTCKPHGLTNYQFVKVSGIYGLDGAFRIFQAEVKDEYSFKLIGANTSSISAYERNVFVAKSFTKTGLLHFSITLVEKVEQFVSTSYYMHSGDWSGFVILGWDNETTLSGVIGIDPDYDSHTYSNAVFTEKKASAYTEEGALYYLPETLNNYITRVKLADHLPDITVSKLFAEVRNYLGFLPFVSDSSKNVDLKLIDDILADHEYIDITRFSQKINNNEKPGYDGYFLQSKIDSGDDNMKTLMTVTSIDTSKYNVKESVANFSSLPADDNTNDVRLARAENIYYVFSKAFLNEPQNWKILCYNLLDAKSGNGDYKVSTEVSTLLPDKNGSKLSAFGNPCNSKTFAQIEEKMNLRLLIYHGLLERDEYNLPYASHDVYDETGAQIPGANYALTWESILVNYRSREIDWQVNRRLDFKTKTIWPVKYLVDFKFWKKYRVDGIDNLVKSIRMNLNDDDTITFNDTELVRV